MNNRTYNSSVIRRKRKLNRFKKYSTLLIVLIIFALFLVFMLDRYVISVLTVEGDSMQNTLFEGDKLLVKKININSENIKRDDIIYFIGNDNRPYLKRVIGVGDDVVEVINDKVFVNGVQKLEEYTKGEETDLYDTSKWFIKDNQLFVLGDNRFGNSSKDSRIFGPIDIKQVKGKVIYIFSSEREK